MVGPGRGYVHVQLRAANDWVLADEDGGVDCVCVCDGDGDGNGDCDCVCACDGGDTVSAIGPTLDPHLTHI